eukprot:IDg5193t1
MRKHTLIASCRNLLYTKSRGSQVEPKASIKVKALRSDNGGEYLSTDFKNYLTEKGIKHQLTVAYTPQQNGVAERMNQIEDHDNEPNELISVLNDPPSPDSEIEDEAREDLEVSSSSLQKTAQNSTLSEDKSTGSFSNSADTQSFLRRSTRHKRPPGQWWKNQTPTPGPTENGNENTFETALFADDAPLSYKEATSAANIDFWAPGIKREEDSIRENNTFTLVHGVDYSETYAPVVTLATVRVFLAIVAQLDLECDQMDVITAFLNGDLDEDLYMQVPAGFQDPLKPNQVCKLHKASMV